MTETYDADLEQDKPEQQLALMDATDQARSLAGHEYQIRNHLEQAYHDLMRFNTSPENNVIVTRAVESINATLALTGELHAAVQGIAAFATEVKQQRDKAVKKFVRLRVAVQNVDTQHPDVAEMIRSIEDGYYDVETEDAKDRLMHAHPMDAWDAGAMMEYLLDDNVPYDRSAREQMIKIFQAFIKDIQEYDPPASKAGRIHPIDPTPEAAETAASGNQV